MMAKRASGADTAAGVGVALGLLAAFLPWYSYSTTTARVTVDAFRASVLGDAFFIAVAAVALILLMRRGLVADVLGERISQRTALSAAAWCTAAIVALQLILIAAGGRSIGIGLPFAALAAAAIVIAAWMSRPHTEPRRTVGEMLKEGQPD